MKPIIGVVGRVMKNEEGRTSVLCFEGIRKSILRHGGIPILILPPQDVDYENENPKLTESEKEDLKRIIGLCDGIVMPGTCRLYEYDRFIYKYALEKDMPILGICGGMQLIVLNDDINPSESLDLIETFIEHNNSGYGYVHNVTIKKGTKLYDIIGVDVIRVNSRHKRYVKSVNNLIVSAVSEDGLIEAVEYKDKKFVVGVQWHPEALTDIDEASNKLFEEFISVCKN